MMRKIHYEVIDDLLMACGSWSNERHQERIMTRDPGKVTCKNCLEFLRYAREQGRLHDNGRVT